jgi:hypothetical protein
LLSMKLLTIKTKLKPKKQKVMKRENSSRQLTQ